VPWAGLVEPGLWIESYSVKPLETFSARDIEYKGLTATGFETPWLSDGLPCGTQGMAVALIGFAVRLKPSAKAAAYDCEYSGYFQSGTLSGPFRNGAPCRSTVANDPLEGMQIRIVRRQPRAERPANTAAPTQPTAAARGAASPEPPKSVGKPRHGKAKTGVRRQPVRPSVRAKKRGATATRAVRRPPGKLARRRP
jgi:hypothetical protein